ncbi:MAG: hypothetical protein KC620_00495 [Myxococcales bacterium]|nr:hypothetical protein [Myxococcales bacterium]
MREVIFASTQSALAEAVRAEAMRIGTDAGPGVIAGYVRERDLESLRALYARERPRVARALAGAGFDGLSEQEVSLRVDFRSGALIVAVTLDEGGDHILSAAANTEGSPVGHQTEVGADGGLARMGSLFWMLGVAGVLIAGVWLAPQLLRRRA